PGCEHVHAALHIVAVDILEDPLAGGRREYRPVQRRLLPQPERLIIRVVEKPVLLDTTADLAAELVLVEPRDRHAVAIIEPVVRREVVVAVIPIASAVQIVGARGRAEADLR